MYKRQTIAIAGLGNGAPKVVTAIPASAIVSTNFFRNFAFSEAALRGRARGGTGPGLRRTHMTGTTQEDHLLESQYENSKYQQKPLT